MKSVYANIILSNPVNPGHSPVEVNCRVDNGATFLSITQQIADLLGLKEEQKRAITSAEDTQELVPYVGPLKVEFGNRICFAGAMVIGEQCTLGAMTIEDLDLVVHPWHLHLMVNPESPHHARGFAK